MKKLLLVIAIAIGTYVGYIQYHPSLAEAPAAKTAQNDALAGALASHAHNVQVQGEGRVIKVLSDDNDGSRHQRFLIRLGSGQTVLIAHNIDLAPRIALRAGDTVSFAGQYEWNSKGGVVHWTHHDPAGRHPGGWLKHNGKTFQ